MIFSDVVECVGIYCTDRNTIYKNIGYSIARIRGDGKVSVCSVID